MENRELAARYARALSRADKLGVVDADAQLLLDCFHTNHQLLAMFQEIMVPSATKLTAIRHAFSEKLHPTFDQFLKLVASKNRMDHLPLILKEFMHLRDQGKGTLHGVLRMATPLSPDEVKHLEKSFATKLGRPCELDPIMDERLIGGFTVRIEDTVYDSSVRTQLDSIRSKFLNLVG